jgi:hypothetical protein
MFWKKEDLRSFVYPWKKVADHAVGGLFQVGYAEDSDLLLVLSHNGRGIFDCLTGERIGRDTVDVFAHFNTSKLLAKGFAALNKRQVRMAGIYGGGLPLSTEDGWFLERHRDKEKVFLSKAAPTQEKELALVGDDDGCNLKAFGFSETGQSFVVATGCSLIIFARETLA